MGRKIAKPLKPLEDPWERKAPTLVSIHEIVFDPEFQMRAGGIVSAHVKDLMRAVDGGTELPPIKLAKIGRSYYLVDGWHRVAAAERREERSIPAVIATMNRPQALREAIRANSKHGRNMSRKDKAKAWEAFVGYGLHLAPDGRAKSLRTLAQEFGHYSHQTIGKKLKAMGVELQPYDVPEKLHPWGLDRDEHDYALENEMLWQGIERNLARLEEVAGELEDDQARGRLIREVRELLRKLEANEAALHHANNPPEPEEDLATLLDI